MRNAFTVVALLCCSSAFAQGECKKERPLTKPEQAFFEKAKASAKALPAAPKGWEQHPEEITAPAKLCTDADPMFKKGQARLNVVAETEYRDTADRTAKMEAASKAGQPTADETKKGAELTKKMGKTDGGAALQTLEADQQKLMQAQLDRGNKAMHEAGLDGEARVRISFNPVSESSTGCGYQKAIAPLKIEGVTHAFAGTCDFSSNPQEPEAGVLLLFGAWTQKTDGSALEATPNFDAKKPHSVVQAMSVLITGDAQRPEELLKGIDVKALAALVGK
jgi:hypothetical protein